ncbi:MAG: pyruvate kinase [Actinobacteria bacterium]|jgi:pyruvate kinase|uniref:pyruvate kinase n=1 Tax=freshwater metagenome TaxID=449393 RepID=A0A6J6HM07_9ZZZZ|nr:pyruvate kinase [Actinomycetota bacterium]MSX69338.1 pyruvate kinase [Actinomycetota bacterium]MSY15871.1 pyruvate kinase [Actinomycetota bacterium]MSY64645.1 pyruvate kinase [Actinomycetota bacterium]MSZ54127.1 pyruvate kinase [Actinomycetota bacterium]
MRRAKIVCTIGPAVESVEKIAELVDAGMNMARLNLSHGDYAEHQSRMDMVRAAAKKANKPIAVLVDLQGPKIRLARFADGPHELSRGDIFTITTDEIEGSKERVGTTYKGLPGDCKPGDYILIDDGKVTVQVSEVKGNDVITKVIQPGMVSNNKGLNLPGVAVSVPALSEKDIADLRWGLKAGADFIALSFVRSAADIKDVHKIMDEVGARVPVIAKIEKPQAVENLQEIVDAFDGIMVARGDLGVELPIEEVPMVQKRCVTLARESAKPVIVATQMLDSMISNSRPTRAEATDCANAVLDGADALMLSGETSVGDFPIETVQTMARIIEHTETVALDQIPPLKHSPATKGGAITKAATEVGLTVGAKYLVAFTQSGDSARRMSRLRSPIPMLAMTPDVGTYNRLALSWGVEPMLTAVVNHTDEMVMQVDTLLIESKRVNIADLVLIVAGSPPGIPGSINAMRVHKIGDAVGGAAPAYRK